MCFPITEGQSQNNLTVKKKSRGKVLADTFGVVAATMNDIKNNSIKGKG